MKKCNFWAILGTLTVSAAFWACSTATLPPIPDFDDDEVAEVTDESSDSKAEATSSSNKSSSEKASSSSQKQDASSSSAKETASSDSKEPESSSSIDTASSSSEEPKSSSSEEKVESSSTAEKVESSSSAEPEAGVSSSSEHKVPEKATEQNTQSISNRKDVMEEVTESPSDIKEMIESEELVKSDSLVFNENDLNFEKNDYYCYDAENEGWYKISGSKWKGFIAGLIDWWNKLINGERYFDYSKVCDEIYIKAKSK